MDSVIAVYSVIGVAIFVICSLALDSSYRPEHQRKMIGWAGLSAPVWPIAAVVALVIAVIMNVRRMITAAKGEE